MQDKAIRMNITQHVGELVRLPSYITLVWQHDKTFLLTVLGKLVGKTIANIRSEDLASVYL
jgi:hypothetical protein